ncbi:MAG: aldehyde ferredoxin oxidoreductase C-terminal domain-containing protein, partial [Chloroflexota bacterium]|nr:aldehyde ferredoxin oxidoreductase C-terminal domain-containing protein [Chloroflexota bacterium]
MNDCFPSCSFRRLVLTQPIQAEAVSAITGEPWSVEDFGKVAQRLAAVERLFNMREGLTRKEDTLPPRLLNQPKPDGPNKGYVVPLDRLLDDYYRALGWDPATGGPTDAVLAELGLEK